MFEKRALTSAACARSWWSVARQGRVIGWKPAGWIGWNSVGWIGWNSAGCLQVSYFIQVPGLNQIFRRPVSWVTL